MSDGLSDGQRATAWQEGQSRVARLARDAEALDAQVPACPDWSVKDLVGHVVGVGVEHLAGTAAEGHPPEWTERTVADRRDRPLEAVLQEWLDATPAVVDLLREGGEPGLLIDLTVHEHDLRQALAQPGFRDSAGARAVETMVVDLLVDAAADLPALRVVAGEHDVVLGTGTPLGALEVDAFELARAAFGRRSEEQVRAWAWPSDPGPWIGLLPLVGEMRETPLVEPA